MVDGGPTIWDYTDPPPPPQGLNDRRSLDERFAAWIVLPEAKEIVSLFRARIKQITDARFRHYAINALTEVVRWHFNLKEGPEASGFKINAVYESRLARWLMAHYPEEFPTCTGCPKHPGQSKPFFFIRRLHNSEHKDHPEDLD